MSSKYILENTGEFIIHDYNNSKPWASFFPGIAGLFGIPLWVFYVNRGQCIASAGVRSKDEAIMEFLPANKAYQLTPSQGFRTFIKIKGKNNFKFYEPFSVSGGVLDPRIRNFVSIRPYDLSICEENKVLGLRTRVNYFCVPGAPFAGLIRELSIENISKRPLDLEVLDGASVIVPCGVNNWFLKEMSRTIEAWMSVENVRSGTPVFKLTTDARDTAHVAFIKAANFYTSFEPGKDSSSSKIIVDPLAVFGEVTDFSYPAFFTKSKNYTYPSNQVAANKTPCAFTFLKRLCPPKGPALKLYSVVGHVFDVKDIRNAGIDRLSEKFIEVKRQENRLLIEGIMDRIFTVSGFKNFDLYARQTYLDNVLRGGLPYSMDLDQAKKTLYVYSRKHGDLERDYNRFCVSATKFSEGEGNYRDVNQNRRSDAFFEPSVAEKNIYDFINLIQLDGYNPLIFKGDRFVISGDDFFAGALNVLFHEKDIKKISHILSKPFTIGEIFSYMEENKISVSCTSGEFVKKLMRLATGSVEASFGEGYWSDHWTYNTDLMESFLSIYPERFKELLLEKSSFTFYDTAVFVKPRVERYTVQHGSVRQYHSVATDEARNVLILKRRDNKHKVRSRYGEGELYTTTLLDKLTCLIANKISTLDPFGAGIEMEADKPNWYDALNGLPGLFGSSISETFELKRLIEFIKSVLKEFSVQDQEEVLLTKEVFEFISGLKDLLERETGAFEYWDRSNILKEEYRFKARGGVSGERIKTNIAALREFFELALNKIEKGIAVSFDEKSGFYTTYFSYHVSRHDSSEVLGKHVVVPREFQQKKLPLFLEGFVHALRTQSDSASDIYKAVRRSPLWDKKLKMYKVNASLADESYELGRAKAFTPGWLENESIWLHMEYKYLLELLKSGLCDEFYSDLNTMLVPFQKPEKYGRSILENSSFIASSAHPDPSLHGRGFVARLSGSTAEFIHMWLLMNMGRRPFSLDGKGELNLKFSPLLHSKLFTKKPVAEAFVDLSGNKREAKLPARSYGFLLFGRALVVYLNPKLKNTYGRSGVVCRKARLFNSDKLVAEVESGVLKAPYSAMVRNGQIERIEIELG